MPLRLARLTLAVAMTSACASPADTVDEGVEVEESAINGGAAERGFAATGLIDTATGSFCSGVLIRPDVVLTAAHCVLTDFGVEKPDAFYIGPGVATRGTADEVPRTTRLRKYGVAAAVAFGKADDILTEDCPHASPDVALVRLSEPVAGVEPAALGDEPELGTVCTVVGYGHHEVTPTRSTKFRRRSAKLRLAEVFPQALRFTNETGISSGGDSGGPLYCDGKVTAVVSCGKNDATLATDDYFARLAKVRGRITRQLARWNP